MRYNQLGASFIEMSPMIVECSGAPTLLSASPTGSPTPGALYTFDELGSRWWSVNTLSLTMHIASMPDISGNGLPEVFVLVSHRKSAPGADGADEVLAILFSIDREPREPLRVPDPLSVDGTNGLRLTQQEIFSAEIPLVLRHFAARRPRVFDVNKDGRADVLLLGKIGTRPSIGAVLFGADAFPAEVSISQGIDGTNGFTFEFDPSFWEPMFMGHDFDGMDASWAIQGYTQDSLCVASDLGGLWVKRGQPAHLVIALEDMFCRDTGRRMLQEQLPNSTANDTLSGFDLPATAFGDVNGDGWDDLVLGESNSTVKGFVEVLFGNASGDDAAPTNGRFVAPSGSSAVIEGTHEMDGFGRDVAFVDVNGDQIRDLVVLSHTRAFVVFGRPGRGDLISGSIAELTGTLEIGGMVLDASREVLTMSGGADLNGDGFEDLCFGVWDRVSSTGSVYVVFGSSSESLPSSLDLAADVSSQFSTSMHGLDVDNTTAGYFVECNPNVDFDGDGVDDFLVRGANRSSIFRGARSTSTPDTTPPAAAPGGSTLRPTSSPPPPTAGTPDSVVLAGALGAAGAVAFIGALALFVHFGVARRFLSGGGIRHGHDHHDAPHDHEAGTAAETEPVAAHADNDDDEVLSTDVRPGPNAESEPPGAVAADKYSSIEHKISMT